MDIEQYDVRSISQRYFPSYEYLFSYDPAFIDHSLSTVDILRYRAGSSTEFVKIFEEMCRVAGLQAKTITGFAKNSYWKPGKSNASRK